MKRMNLTLLVIIFSLAVIAMICIQSVWLRTSIDMSHSVFSSDVARAASDFISDIEKNEIHDIVKKRDKISFSLKMIDSLNNSLQALKISNPDVFFDKNIRNISDIIETQDETWIVNQEKEDKEDENLEANNSHEKKRDTRSVKNVQKAYKQLKEQRDFFLNRSKIIDDYLQSVTSDKSKLPFVERVNIYQIDSLLIQSLHKYNIDNKFEWAIFSTQHNKVIVQKTNKFKKELIKSNHLFKMFPSEMTDKGYYLILYFPDKELSVFSEIYLLLIFSVIIVAVILFVFIYSIRILIKTKKLSEAKATFINHITHELKTPISTISLICEAMNDDEILKNEAFIRKNINTIEKENSRLKELTSRIIKISKLEKGEILLNNEKVSLHQILQEAAEQMKIQIESKNGKIAFHFEAIDDIILGDHENLLIVFGNLIDNALKYNNNIPIIDIFTKNEEGKVVVKIKDNGIGISKKHLPHIFENFYRVTQGDIHRNDGFGLGLSFVKLLVDKLGGSISINSEIGKGTIFIIEF